MSKVFSKNKGKRSRSSSNEANNSFVKNMTSRMSGLLPATITKWFSSPKATNTNTNGSVAMADSDDSSTDDECVPSSVITQPPAKRMRYSTNTMPSYNNHFGIDEMASPIKYEEVDHMMPSTSFSVQSPSSRAMYRREQNFESTSLRSLPAAECVEDNIDQDSHRFKNFASTPLAASPADRAEVVANQDSPVFKSQHTVSKIGHSVVKKRKSLFYNDSPARQQASLEACAKTSNSTMRDPNQPCFKASLLGSPFYPGRTMYGGAGACTYLNEPNVKQRKVAVVNEASNVNNTMSTAARRVMDLLEHYSSPLIDAKRISQFSKSASEINTSGDPVMNLSNRIKLYKTQELQVPSVAAFLRLKHRNRLMESTSAARQIMASQSSTADHLPYSCTPLLKKQDADSSKFTSKIKSRVTKRQPIRNVDFEFAPTVELPTGTLQIDQNNLPKFTFDGPVKPPAVISTDVPMTSMQSTQTNSIDGTSSKSNTSLSKPNALTNENFKFSSPITISAENPQNCNNMTKFTFGSPDRTVDKEKDSVSCVVGLRPISTVKTKEWKCPDCWVSNKQADEKCICCSGKKPSSETQTPAKCTVCKDANTFSDKIKCSKCDKLQSNKIVISSNKKWKCSDCWVDNEKTAEKCVCCGAKNTKNSKVLTNSDSKKNVGWKCNTCWITNKSTVEICAACGESKPGVKSSAPANTASSSKGFKYGIPSDSKKMQSGSNSWNNTNTSEKIPVTSELSNCVGWRCSDCWVMNKNTLVKCAACDGAKPSDKKETTVNSTKLNTNLSGLVKTQSSKWECGSCLVRNDNDKLKCVCCEAAKPGTESQASDKHYNFGTLPNTSFKFGINPINLLKTIRAEVANEEKKLESEKNNNILPKAAFSFSFSDKKDLVDKVKKNIDTPKSGFTFGIPDTSNTVKSNPTLVNFLNSSKKSAENENPEDNEQEVPKMPELKNLPISNSTNTIQLNVTPNKQDCKDKPTETSTSLLTPTTYFSMPEKTKDTSKNTQIVPSSATTVSESQPTFSFSSGSKIRINSNLFNSPTNSTISGITANRKISMTTATVTSLQASEAKNTMPILQNTETTTTSVTTAPLFSFGSGVTTATATPTPTSTQTDATTKFNFTFGSNSKSESLFKSPFGTGNSSSTNIFTSNTETTSSALPTANSLTTSTTLTTNDMFQTSTQKENMWSSPNNNNASTTAIFVTNTVTSEVQKPPGFSFATSTSTPAFGANATASATPIFGNPSTTNGTPAFGTSSSTNTTPAFGSNAGTNATPAFGNNSLITATPAFGNPSNNAASSFGSSTTTGVFGNGTGTTPAFGASSTPFGTAAASTTPAFGNAVPAFGSSTTFGNAQTTAQPTFGSSTTTNAFGLGNQNSNASTMFSPVMNNSTAPLFGSPQANSTTIQTPAFGSSTTSFEPSFNFGSAASQTTGMFGFGQQPAQAGIYNFGGAPAAPVQFNMGSGPASGIIPNTGGRKIRKATRRTNAPR